MRRAISAAMFAAVFAAGLLAHRVLADSLSATQPPPSTMMPPSINTLDGSVGVSDQYARADHQHPTSVQRFATKTGADGSVTWAFKKPFADTSYATWGSPGAAGIGCAWSGKTATSVVWTCRAAITQIPAANVPLDLAAGTATQ